MIPALIAAGATLLGGHLQNQASARAAREQMQFQEEMSNTSYQRQIKDLEAAGINPMLVTKLGGASTPPGAMPSFINPAAMASQSFSAAQSSAAAMKQAETAERMTDEQIKNVNAMTEKIKEEIKNVPLEGERLKEMAFMLWNQAKLLGSQNWNQREIEQQIIATTKKVIAETDLIKFDIQAAQQLDNLGREVKQLEPIVNIIKAIIGRR